MDDSLHYSVLSTERHRTHAEFSESDASAEPVEVAKKVNRRRAKSLFRDALYRPVFQALEGLEGARAEGGTSVTYATPSHPLFPYLHLKSNLHSPASPPLAPEQLSDEEEARAARHWRAFIASTPRKHRAPATWRDLSDEYRLEWFHHALRHAGPCTAFTLNLDADTEARVRSAPNGAGWLSKRIARQLKAALGQSVDFWFAFEETPGKRLHVHGELAAGTDELPAVRKALRLAGGEWTDIRQHQAHTHTDPSVVWPIYAAKQAIFAKPKHGRLAHIPRPVNGDWLFATNATRTGAKKIYDGRRAEVLSLLKDLPH